MNVCNKKKTQSKDAKQQQEQQLTENELRLNAHTSSSWYRRKCDKNTDQNKEQQKLTQRNEWGKKKRWTTARTRRKKLEWNPRELIDAID